MPIEKCFFCEKIIIPLNLMSLSETENFFKSNDVEFTLKYERSRLKIGNKIVCLRCEEDFRRILKINEEAICENCKKEEEEETEVWKIK